MTSELVARVLYDQNTIDKRSTELCAALDKDYSDKCPMLVGIMSGAYMFLGDISKKLKIQHTIDFMCVSSYSGTTSTGELEIKFDLKGTVKGRHVIIVEDIIDSGRTLTNLVANLLARGAISVECCVLLAKPSEIKFKVPVKYLGFSLVNPEFVIGYGMDYNEMFRGLPFIGVPTQKAIEMYK